MRLLIAIVGGLLLEIIATGLIVRVLLAAYRGQYNPAATSFDWDTWLYPLEPVLWLAFSFLIWFAYPKVKSR